MTFSPELKTQLKIRGGGGSKLFLDDTLNVVAFGGIVVCFSIKIPFCCNRSGKCLKMSRCYDALESKQKKSSLVSADVSYYLREILDPTPVGDFKN